MILPDVIEPGLRIVFCGTAAGAKSAAVGAYYAGPGNAFWATLHERERLGPCRAFVLPSTSGAARGFWDVRRWHDLAAAVARDQPNSE